MSTTTTVQVTGMTCAHCVAAVSRELGALAGVSDVAVELNAGGVTPVTVTSSGPPARAASTTQCARWSSSRPRLTACSAFVTAATWVRTSMQYVSASTIRCRPRTCPSTRRSRVR